MIGLRGLLVRIKIWKLYCFMIGLFAVGVSLLVMLIEVVSKIICLQGQVLMILMAEGVSNILVNLI